MGIDFIKRVAPTFSKAWNRNKKDLALPTLFTRYPECHTRTVIADLSQDADLKVGSDIVVCAKGAKLILISGNTQTGVIQQPPTDLMTAIHEAGDCALANITRINPLSRTADVEFE